MNKLFFVALLFGLLTGAAGKAQGGSEAYPDGDTLFSDDEIREKANEGSYFNPVSLAPPADIRTLPDSVEQQAKSDKDYWYLNYRPGQKKEANKEPKAYEPPSDAPEPTWRKWLFWTLIIGIFMAVVIWALVTGDVRLFHRKSRTIRDAEAPLEEEPETEDIFSMNFERELEKARSVRNFRLMVRLQYLRTLRDLSNRGMIDYAHDPPNSVYLAQLSGSQQYRDFFRLTRHFEYTWYGQFTVTEPLYGQMEQDFLTFKQRLS